MKPSALIAIIVVVLVAVLWAMSMRVMQYQMGVLFRLGRARDVCGTDVHLSVHRHSETGVPSRHHDADPVAGHHRQGQREYRGRRGRSRTSGSWAP